MRWSRRVFQTLLLAYPKSIRQERGADHVADVRAAPLRCAPSRTNRGATLSMVGELGEMIRGGLSDEAAVLAGNMPHVGKHALSH